MVKRCEWGTCNSDSKHKDKEYMKDVTFWPIPKPKTRLRETLQWVKACNRKHLTVKNIDKHAYVCSKHFPEGRPTANYPIPLTAGSSPSQTQSKPTRKIPVRKIATQLHLQNHTVVTSSSNAEIESIPSLAAFISVEYTDVTDHDSNANEGLSLAMFGFLFTFLSNSAKSMTYWRGGDTSNERKQYFFQTHKKGPKRVLSIKEEMMLMLLRLRRGYDSISLSNMFGISDTLVSRIFATWTSLVSKELGFLIRWPSKEQVKFKRPACFKHFPKTRCIIDCTEFFVQKPSLPSAQRITYSSYKHHNNFKYLVRITPRGSFSFIFNLFTGSISDKKIVEQSGFLDKVEYGDDIMADRGFLIRGELALKGTTLNIPPFTMGKLMCSAATTKTRRIAHARIHVERAIGRL
ncbi:uncharacterized protein LOC144620957 [Crassostrea virginica]